MSTSAGLEYYNSNCDLIKTIHILSTNLLSLEALSCILSGLQ